MSTRLWLNEYIDDWMCAFPLGNGRVGAMVYGNPQCERIEINEESLWSGRQIEEKYHASAEVLAEKLIGKLFDDYDYHNSEVAVMVNGLGGTPAMELYIMYNEVEKILSANNIKIYKSYVGNYLTSLEMAGCSITLLKLDDELKTLLDHPVDVPAFK